MGGCQPPHLADPVSTSDGVVAKSADVVVTMSAEVEDIARSADVVVSMSADVEDVEVIGGAVAKPVEVVVSIQSADVEGI